MCCIRYTVSGCLPFFGSEVASFFRVFFIALSLVFSLSTQAQSLLSQIDSRLMGFGTLGVVISDSDALGFRRDTGQSEGVYRGDINLSSDSLLGLQWNARYSDWLSLAVQAKSKYLNGSLDSYINLAFVRYSPASNVALRMGRLPMDAYLLSESRDVGISYLWARPVVEFYGQLLLEHFDGVDFLYHRPALNGVLEFRAGAGQYDNTGVQSAYIYLHSDFEPMWNLNVQYMGEKWRWRAGYLQTEIGRFVVDGIPNALRRIGPMVARIPPELLSSGNKADQSGVLVRQFSLSGAFDDGQWLIQAEMGRLTYERAFYTGYISAGYRFGKLTPYTVLSRNYGESRDIPSSINRLEPDVEREAGHLLNVLRGSSDQTALSLGLRWDLTSTVAVKGQWDSRWIGKNHVYLWMHKRGEYADTQVNTFSLVVDFNF